MNENNKLESWAGVLCHLEADGPRLTSSSREIAATAVQLARRAGIAASAVFITSEPEKNCAKAVAGLGFERACVYSSPLFELYAAGAYAAALIDAAEFLRPSVLLLGSGDVGKDIAPLAAAHFRSGLTADCTGLEILEGGNLLQIRPAFGGGLMAEILTPETRPQFATVRGGIMSGDGAAANTATEIVCRELPPPPPNLPRVLERRPLPREESIAEARLLVAIGGGLKEAKDVEAARRLANALGGSLASTRVLVERGWMPPASQIGLSGHSVSPDVLLALGVSGSLQFMAGAGGAKYLIAVNSDPSARIFSAAHLGLCCDLYEVLPLLERISLKPDAERFTLV